MRNRFQRCCCDGEPPPPPVETCRICDLDCSTTSIAVLPGVLILNDRHPDEGTDGFLAKGRLSGDLQLVNRSSRVRLIFNHNFDNSYDYIELQPRDNGQITATLRREGSTVDGNTQFFQGSLYGLIRFCLHFEETGHISLLLYTITLQNGIPTVLPGAFWTFELPPGIGGGVGYFRNDATSISGVSFYRAASESNEDRECIGCAGTVCEPCCTEGPTPAWLLQWPGGLSDGDWTGCDEAELAAGTYVLESHISGNPCEWSFGNSSSSYAINPVVVAGCFDYGNFPFQPFGVLAWHFFNASIRHINGRCRLTVELHVEHARPDTLCCASCLIARWLVEGSYDELCRGTHTLALNSSSSLCGNHPATLQLIAL